MPNDERLQPTERIEDDVIIRGEITEERIVEDERRRFGRFVEIVADDSEFTVRFKVGHQSFECFNRVPSHEAAEWFRDQLCRAIHNLVNEVINMQADKIERLYHAAMPQGCLVGTQQQVAVLMAASKRARSVLDDLRSIEAHGCVYKGESLECFVIMPIAAGHNPRADWCGPCCAKWILDRGDVASNL